MMDDYHDNVAQTRAKGPRSKYSTPATENQVTMEQDWACDDVYDLCCDVVKTEPAYENLLLEPIVYTTKLDEMKIFKRNITNMDIDTYFYSIIKESKPKLNIKRKRYAHSAEDPNISYENLSCHINAFNKKVTRKNIIKSRETAKELLSDIKHSTCTSQNKYGKERDEINKSPNPMDLDTLVATCNLKCTIIYDIQLEEADMYYIDNNGYVRKNKRLHIDNKILHTLEVDTSVSKVLVHCCCWYQRERYVKSLTLQPETLNFMSKPHKCDPVNCSCCCRQDQCVSQEKKSENPPETSNTWFKTIADRLTSLITSFPSAEQCSTTIRTEENLPFLHSTIIQFEDEYYQIGGDGKMVFFFKKTDENSSHHSYIENLMWTSTNKIVGNICCWYKREEFVKHILELGALPTTVTFIRNPHQCSTNSCTCCCKPTNNNTSKLVLFPMATRFTNDLVSKQFKLKLKFSKIQPILDKPVKKRNIPPTTRKMTFNISEFVSNIIDTTLTETQNIHINENPFLSAKYTLHNRYVALQILESISKAQFSIDSQNHIIAKINNLKTISKTELELLHFYFRVVAAENNKRARPHNTQPKQVPNQAIETEQSHMSDQIQLIELAADEDIEIECFQITNPIQLTGLAPDEAIETERFKCTNIIQQAAPDEAIESNRIRKIMHMQLTAPDKTAETERLHKKDPIQVVALDPKIPIETERLHTTDPLELPALSPGQKKSRSHIQTRTDQSNLVPLCSQLSILANLKSKRFIPPLRKYAQKHSSVFKYDNKIDSYDYSTSTNTR